MEALAAVGLASNVLQFIECGYKVVGMAKELYESGHEATRSNAEAAFVAQEMRELSLKLVKDLPTADLTDEEEALCRLAQQCSLLSNKLLLLLDSLKTKKPRRKIEIIRTVLRNMRKRNERDQLQASLDNCRRQLNTHICYMSRSDIVTKLEIAIRSTRRSQQDILYLRDHVQKLQQKSTIDSASMASFFRDLQEVVETPLRQNAILHSIRYPRMHDRFDNVEPAHRKTFQWLLEGPADQPSDEQQAHPEAENDTGGFSGHQHTAKRDEAKYRKHREFVDWLQKGVDPPLADNAGRNNAFSIPNKGSIFHIAGKPGAGKSTLMKFLCENETTIEYLKTWAGEKRLICAKAFFWRLGEEEQKNLAGLRNCLLQQILTVAPELIPIAFPSAWGSEYRDLVSYIPTGTAFDQLLKGSRVFEKCKMIFFIDGLDEYKGSPIELIRKIIGWTVGNSADLKICLSSREWNEFEVGFKGCPRFRIQEWTRDDIQIFVMDNFEDIGDLSTSISKDELDNAANAIVDKAEGVFLWVRVVLAAIEQGVLNGDDFQDLQRKISAFPAELRDLYQHLFDSIPEYDRHKAFEALSFAGYTVPQYGSLLQYKFLGDLAKDPDFAINMSMQPLSEEELRRVSKNTGRQINGRCKGFLEIFSPKREYHKGDEHVRLMHSTAAGFLWEKDVQDTVESYLGDVDNFERLCHSFLALAKSLDTDDFYCAVSPGQRDYSSKEGSAFYYGLGRIFWNYSSGYGRWKGPTSHSRLPPMGGFRAFLKSVDRVAALRYDERETRRLAVPLDASVVFRILPEVKIAQGYKVNILPSQIIMTLAAQHLLVEYFDRDGLCDLRTVTANPEAAKHIIRAVLSGVSSSLDGWRSSRMLEMLFEAGISPKTPVEIPCNDGSTIPNQLWSWVFARLVFAESSWERRQWREQHNDPEDYDPGEGGQYKLIELFLRYGAGEDLGLMFGPCFEVIGANRLIVLVRVCESDGIPIEIFGLGGICVDYQLEIAQYARAKGGVLNFRDILAYCFPRDFHHLYEILDGKSPTSPVNDDADDMLVIFPTENRFFEGDSPPDTSANYIFDGKRVPWGCKQCLAHSEKCFRDFEAKFEDERSGRPYIPLKHPPVHDDDDDDDDLLLSTF
ncbi:hypothetical protein Hte_007847 [Hypoxylon texense]